MSNPEADLLKVAADAGLEDLKKAYRRAALAHHPDQNPHPEAARHFRRITEAYRVLEARAAAKEPPRAPRVASPAERVGFLLADVRGLLRRWPADRWTGLFDGLPAGVWVISALEVLAEAWPGAPAPSPGVPTPEGVAEAVAAWSDRLARHPVPADLPRPRRRRLEAALSAAEDRLHALDRPPGRRHYER
jgi:hypothetical protein